jgi:hypothetical protein
VNGTYLLGDEMGVDSSDVSRANKKQVEQLMMAGLHVQMSSSSWHLLDAQASKCVDVMFKLEKFIYDAIGEFIWNLR